MLALGASVAGAVAFVTLGGTATQAGPRIMVWKSPTCGCCGGWISYMRGRGYQVTINDIEDIARIKDSRGIPDALQSCHTAEIEGYLLEGHVPEPAVAKLLQERPAVKGIALPGMPEGAPGMDGRPGRYQVLAFDREGSIGPFTTTGI
jgi:hypothetical protein